jgi:hypothetical protein
MLWSAATGTLKPQAEQPISKEHTMSHASAPQDQISPLLTPPPTSGKAPRRGLPGFLVGFVATACLLIVANTVHTRPQLALILTGVGALTVFGLRRRASGVGVVVGILTVFALIAAFMAVVIIAIMRSPHPFG